MNYEDIKAELLKIWDELDGEDGRCMSEAAESALPVYYSDIIEQWTKMDSEFTDSWQETGVDMEHQTITSLMLIDLYMFIQSEYTRAYAEIQEEKEEAAND